MICGGPGLKPELCPFGQVGFSGVDDDQPGPLFQLIQEQTADFPFFIGVGGITAPCQYGFALVAEIRHRIKPTGMHPGHFPGRVTDILHRHTLGEPNRLASRISTKCSMPLGIPWQNATPLAPYSALILRKRLLMV